MHSEKDVLEQETRVFSPPVPFTVRTPIPKIGNRLAVREFASAEFETIKSRSEVVADITFFKRSQLYHIL